jgi:hypothetical protein
VTERTSYEKLDLAWSALISAHSVGMFRSLDDPERYARLAASMWAAEADLCIVHGWTLQEFTNEMRRRRAKSTLKEV